MRAPVNSWPVSILISFSGFQPIEKAIDCFRQAFNNFFPRERPILLCHGWLPVVELRTLRSFKQPAAQDRADVYGIR